MPSKIKRVAMVVFSQYPADPRVRREAEALERMGIRVDIICLKWENQLKKETINTINVYRLPISQSRGSKTKYIIEYLSFFLLAFFKLTGLHFIRNYDIVHVHNMPDFLVFTALVPRIFGKKVFLDLHDPTPEVYMSKYNIGYDHPMIRNIIFQEKVSIGFASKIITPNTSFKKIFVERGCPADKITIIMNSPQTDIFKENLQKDSILNISKRETVKLMYHGTLAKRNGLLTAIEAVEIIHKKSIPVHFSVFGGGDSQFIQEFLDLIKTKHLTDIITFHGYKSLEEISREIEKADIGVIPNNRSPFTEFNMPTRIFEYLCMGIPTIAPKTTGVCDYFSDENIHFFTPGDPEDLASVFEKIILNPVDAFEKTKKGIEIYKEHRWKKEELRLTEQVYEIGKFDMKNPQRKSMKLYYFLKPLIPRTMQLRCRKRFTRLIRSKNRNCWPILESAGTLPEGWIGWPDEKEFALLLRHDIESAEGMSNIYRIMDLEEKLGFRSSFNFSPERYSIPQGLYKEIRDRGFEVGLHGLKHDGKLYSSRSIFERRALRINEYLKKWDIKGFISPSSHHRLDWIGELNISYDSSTFDTDPFEPQNDSVGTIFPFVYNDFIELPYTLPQDLTLLILLGEQNIDIWKNKTHWISSRGGMVHLNTHPDYMYFDNVKEKNKYNFQLYGDFLIFIKKEFQGRYYHVLPSRLADLQRAKDALSELV